MEIIDFYYSPKSYSIQVSFRFDDDNEEFIREDEFDMDLIENHGYYILDDFDNNDFPLIYEEDSDELILDDEISEEKEYNIDENQLLEFISEYYTLNPNKIPPTSIF